MIITDKIERDSKEITLQKVAAYADSKGYSVEWIDGLLVVIKNQIGSILPDKYYGDFENRLLETLETLSEIESMRPSEIFDEIAKMPE